MIALDQALATYARVLTPLPAESVELHLALHRVLAEDQHSTADLPLFTQSAVDGYAVRAADTAGASTQNPLRLPIIGAMPAGPFDELPQLLAHSALRIFTGGAVPAGADSVIPQELVRVDDGYIELQHSFPAARNVRHRGEEVRAGARLAAAGERLTPGLIAALAMGGIAAVEARRRPRIAVFVTGNEIVPLGQPLGPGQIHDSNGPLISSWLQQRGYADVRWARLRDNRAEVEAALAEALDQTDVVITTGGASVGDHDHIPAAAAAVGVKTVFWKVAQKPGKPLYFGLRDQKVMMGFPGNPGAVLIGLVLHLQRVLDLLEGLQQPAPHWLRGRLAAPVKADPERDRLLRVTLKISEIGQIDLLPLPHQDSHMLSNLRLATALIRVPTRVRDYEAGEFLHWLPLAGLQSI